MLQGLKSRLPLCQFSIGQRDVLDDGIALVFVLNLGSMPFNFCRMQELPLRRIENRTLCDGVCQCRCGSFDAEGVSIGPAETRTDEYRRQVVVANFAVGGKGSLDVGSR